MNFTKFFVKINRKTLLMIKLLKRRITNNDYNATSNMLVKHAIKSCRGLPLAISVISGLNLQTDNDWQNIIKIIINKDLEVQELLHGYDYNVFV